MPPLPDLATCKKVGFIVPSSNTAVEPITQAIFQSLNSNIICIFTRIQVKTVGTDANSTSQFSTEAMVAAARLLADAEPDAIVWNGTSGMWVGTGIEADKQLAKAMQDATGIPCSTTTLATVEALQVCKTETIGIAVPYNQALTDMVTKFFTGLGYKVSNSARLEATPASNLEIAKSSAGDMRDVIKDAASGGEVKAVVVGCTNWPAAGLVEELEKAMDVVVVDSVIVTVWTGLRMAGYRGAVSGWGQLMAERL
ncbi:hypothetical protein LTR36_008865 [Oleoguttula mirabilis]|uniref:Asp/Glu racemase n=1 Tax=Oleoguttula mirabilis TaxID=1507867 RepID=A0AAV9J6W3_9PEZI|nr:hypothetical protein LTR36_008865 [Oleoguttula mirabilis]